MEEITAGMFTEAVGHPPIQDDLERCNCPNAGKIGHHDCGWNYTANLPVFMAGTDSVTTGDSYA